ncbi:MAG: hypothetical protein HQL86_07715, partial [Magnetococcales bacterium]|nr:hypothetical protein [Magnetococcales bacterium]
MPTALFPVLNAGPFDRIVGVSYSSLTYSFHVRRDDGLEYTPFETEGVVISLYSHDWNFVCSLWSQADPDLFWYESVPGLVLGCSFTEPYYTIAFNETLLTQLVGQERAWLVLYLVTTGSRTLETTYPRIYSYADESAPFPLTPGRHTIQIPFWYMHEVTTHWDLHI